MQPDIKTSLSIVWEIYSFKTCFFQFTVSFGGCAGLFLGGSLLSFIELIYFLTWRVYYHWRRTPLKSDKSKNKKKAKGRRIVTDTWTMDDCTNSKTSIP